MTQMKAPSKRDPKTIAAAVLVALIVLAGIVLAVVRTFGDNHNAVGPHPGGGGPTQQPAGSSSSCGLPDGDQSIPTSAPSAAWELSGKVAAPRNAAYGPGHFASAPRTCFAHNPTGAVFAAINYYADTTNPDVDVKQLVAARIFTDANSDKASGGAEEATPTYQVTGFRVEDATRDRVSVAVVVRSPEGPTAGDQAAITFTLGWQRGDWRLVVPPTGQPPTTAIATLSGYVAWSGA